MPAYLTPTPGELERQVALRRLVHSPFDKLDSPTRRAALLNDLSLRYQNRSTTFLPNTIVPGTEIEALVLNDIQNAIFVELHTLYEMIKTLDARLHAGLNVVDSQYETALMAANRLKADIKQFELLRDNPEFSHAAWFDFKFLGSSYEGSLPCESDAYSGRLRLGLRSSYNASIRAFEYNPEPLVELLTPGQMVTFADSDVKEAIDPDPSTYWAVAVYNDHPIGNSVIELSRKLLADGSLTKAETYEANGVVLSYSLSFPSAQKMNTIELIPFGRYPFKVVDIQYTDTDSGTFRSIPVFEITRASQNLDPIVFNFETVPAKKIKIIIEQPNFDYVHIDQNDQNTRLKNLLDIQYENSSDLIAGTELPIGTTETQGHPAKAGLYAAAQELTSLLQKFAHGLTEAEQYSTLMKSYSELIKRYGTKRIEERMIRKCVYILGLFDLKVSLDEYAPRGEWRSNKVQNAQHVSRISLITDEEHPDLYDEVGQRYCNTPIHWDIDVGQNKYIPILPLNHVDEDGESFIDSEFLLFSRGVLSVKTRFLANLDKPIIVRKNGLRIRDVLARTIDDSTQIQITANSFNPGAVYTVAYYPMYDETMINVMDHLDSRNLGEPEVFTDTDEENGVTLSTYPYIEPEIINDRTNFNRPNIYDGIWFYTGNQDTVLATPVDSDTPVQAAFLDTQGSAAAYNIKLIDGRPWGRHTNVPNYKYEPISVTVNGQKAYNVTNYISGKHPEMMNQGATSKKFQYIHLGNRLVFNGSIRGGEIKIDYRWIVKYTRLIARMYCGRSYAYDITPKVRSAGLLYSTRAL